METHAKSTTRMPAEGHKTPNAKNDWNYQLKRRAQSYSHIYNVQGNRVSICVQLVSGRASGSPVPWVALGIIIGGLAWQLRRKEKLEIEGQDTVGK